jgi:hypothetical protein
VPPGPLAYVTAFPTGQASPVAAIAVESPQGLMVSNTGIIPAGTNGSVDVYASNLTDLVIDINGYYASISDSSGFNTVARQRLEDCQRMAASCPTSTRTETDWPKPTFGR